MSNGVEKPPTTVDSVSLNNVSQASEPLSPPSTSGTHNILEQFLGSNPYFSAGFGLMGVGVGLAALRRSASLLGHTLRRRMLVSLEIPNRDKSFEWFLTWQAQANRPSALSRFIRSHELSLETTYQQHPNGSSEAIFNLVAGPGTHWFRYKGAWMQVKRERETKSISMAVGIPWETVTLTTLSRDRHLFPLLLAEARRQALKGQEGKLVINTAWATSWRPFGKPRPKRPLESVVLEHGVTERISKDIKSFLSRRKWYADRGIPYRRGYLLHGPPGSGKSSFIQALAGSLSYDICLLNLSERGLADDKLNHLLSNAPERSIILIEDVDAAFNKRVQTTEDGYQSSVTFSGFLNALDGVASGEERIVFMTTNHIEALDPALIRPGRVDLIELLDDASPSQAKRLFLQFYGDGTESSELLREGGELEELVKVEMNEKRRVSMATLQGIFIRHNSAEAISMCKEAFVLRPQ
ncbi:BCS1 N terminal-domain-containing protein [Hysterangium stoloniferum]|nr:BCS1 N terminal-domain-containing protein [Hysterangium stoloniferum]